MATSTILEPIKVNDERGAQIIVDALENAENTERKTVRRASSVVTTDPERIRRVASMAMAKASQR